MGYVYKFINYDNKILYIGKTGNLEKRMNQHFGGQGHLPFECYENIHRIFFIKVDGKTNTDMYETYLINKYFPKYNTDKQFREIISLHNNSFLKYQEIEWSELFFYFDKNGINISFSPIKSKLYSNYLSKKEKCLELLSENIYNMQYRKGMYSHVFGNIIDDYEFLEYFITIIKEIILTDNIDLSLSELDEPINLENSFEFVAFDINLIKNINLEYFLLMSQCKFIKKITKTKYGIVYQNIYSLKNMKENFYIC